MTNNASFDRILKARERREKEARERKVLEETVLPPAAMQDIDIFTPVVNGRRGFILKPRIKVDYRGEDKQLQLDRSRPQRKRNLEEAVSRITRKKER